MSDERSDEEMEGEKEEDIVPQRNESLPGTESQKETKGGGKVSVLRSPHRMLR